MANIKWSGIESWKYGLTARWYVSAYYGNDIDVDAVGYYNPTTNVTGHGGPTRPFASLSKLLQDSTITNSSICVIDSGYYTSEITSSKNLAIIGDGYVLFGRISFGNLSISQLLNILLIGNTLGQATHLYTMKDCFCVYSNISNRIQIPAQEFLNNVFIECNFIGVTSPQDINYRFENNTILNCIGAIYTNAVFKQNLIANSPNLTLSLAKPRVSGTFKDYSIIIGSIKTSVAFNGKTTGVTIEDFEIDGNYFVKSFSEVDLFGNVSGSGASVAQLQTIFNNYFSPIYLDTWQFADLSLKPTASEKVKFGGLNGTYIGAKPVGYHYNAASLWANRNVGNTTNIEIDAVTGYLQIVGANETGTLETNTIDLGTPIICDPVNFMANLVYNSDGTAKQGVANQRIDTNPDALPDNTLNQRVVYDYEFSYSPNGVDALTAFKSFELNRKPTIDGEGDSQLDDNFSQTNAASITVQRFKIKFTLRKIIIA